MSGLTFYLNNHRLWVFCLYWPIILTTACLKKSDPVYYWQKIRRKQHRKYFFFQASTSFSPVNTISSTLGVTGPCCILEDLDFILCFAVSLD